MDQPQPALERVVQISRTREDGSHDLGSGYLVTNELVLTALHVVANDNDKPAALKIQFATGGDWLSVTVLWTDVNLDAALLSLDRSGELDVYPPAEFEEAYPSGAQVVDGVAVGFSSFARQRNADGEPLFEVLHVSGRIATMSGFRAGLFEFRTDRSFPSREHVVSPWVGFSGSPLWVDGRIWGLIQGVDRDTQTLFALRSERLLANSGFRDLIESAGAPDPAGRSSAAAGPQVSVQGDERKPESDARREHVPLYTDAPVALEGDQLGRRAVAEALHGLLVELSTEASGKSFMVHVDGPWGSGKSTLLRFLGDIVTSAHGANSSQWVVVPYDAWRQSKIGPPWLTLLQAARVAVGKSKPSLWHRARFTLSERTRLISRWQWTAGIMLTIGIVVTAFAVLRAGLATTLADWNELAKLAASLVSILAFAWLTASALGRFIALDSRRAAKTFLETRADPMEDLAAQFDWILRQAGGPVLLLIDDLDRCHPEFVVELLDAVQKLMREPNTGKRKAASRTGILVVVVAADARWIRKCYDNAYDAMADSVHVAGGSVGSLFLEKMFQMTVPVPRLPDDVKSRYLSTLLDEGATEPPPSLASDVDPLLAGRLQSARHSELLSVLASAPPLERTKAAGVAIRRLVTEPDARQQTEHSLQQFSSLLEPTPRAMKRFLMAYSMLRAVRTAEGSVVPTNQLALWTILVMRWPLLAEYLSSDPDAVRLFADNTAPMDESVPASVSGLFLNPPKALRDVMNDDRGPLNAEVIQECAGRLIRK